MSGDRNPVELPDLDAILAEASPAPTPSSEPEPVAAAPAAGVAPQPEPPAAPPPAPSVDDRVARGLEALTARERELQQQRREIEEGRRAWEAEKASLEKLRKYEELEARLHDQDAFGALEALGVNFDDLTKAVVEGRGVSPNRKVEQRVQEELSKFREEYNRELSQLKELQRQRQLVEAQAELRAKVSEMADKAVLTAASGEMANEAIIARAQRHYNETGQVPDYATVINEVEQEWTTVLDTILASEAAKSFIRSRYFGESPASGDQSRVTPSKTLTNGLAGQVANRTTETDLPADREDAIEAILASFR